MSEELAWEELGHLKTREVGAVLQGVVRRIVRYLEKRGVVRDADEAGDGLPPEENLAAFAMSLPSHR